MPDVLTPSQRSYNMSQIRSKGTNPELVLEAALRSEGLRNFVKHPKNIQGRPDIYFPREKIAVFMDGCFWHACKQCFAMPSTNKKFWKDKIEVNLIRDKKVNRQLRKSGLNVIRIWEHELEKNPKKVVAKIKIFLASKEPKVLDLFAGAGGLSEGFVRAGCKIVGHIEMEQKACNTLITRAIYHALLQKGKIKDYKDYVAGKITRQELIDKYDLHSEVDSVICARIEEKNFRELIQKIKNRLQGQPLDIIVGGPPCQAYSHIGRSVDDKNMKWDNRKFLYRYYVEFLKALNPKIFVFENVPGLISSGKGKYLQDMRKLMRHAGYETDLKILNTADFGVPQNRRRVILVGWSKRSKMTRYPDFPAVKRNYLVKDFLADLPRISAGKGRQVSSFQSSSRLLKKTGIVSSKFPILMDHVARPHMKQDIEIYRRAVLTKKRGINIKYNTLPKHLKSHKNESAFLDRFRVVDGEARGSQTILAHIAKDGHYYIHPDLKQSRSLTVREAARLQTFPDDYKFEGERGPQFRQIGNAVPPLFAAILAKELIKYL